MKLENDTLIVSQKEYDLVKKYNWIASPYNAGLFLYHALKRKGIILEWDVIFFRNVYIAFRKKKIEVVEECK